MIRNLARRSEQTENEVVKQTDLRTRRTPARLAFADHMNCFLAGDRTPGGPKGPEMLARLDPAFDSPMILFQDVIEVPHWSMLAVLLQSSLGF